MKRKTLNPIYDETLKVRLFQLYKVKLKYNVIISAVVLVDKTIYIVVTLISHIII